MVETGIRRRPLVVVGIAINLIWTAFLFGVCAFDDGSFREDWVSCIMWCGLVGLPAALALTGLIKAEKSFVVAAASLCIPLTLISLAGAGIPMIVPGVLFGIAAAGAKEPDDERQLHEGYFAVAAALLVIGFIGMFSFGAPFFLLGLVMLALTPWAKRGSRFVLPVIALLGVGMILCLLLYPSRVMTCEISEQSGTRPAPGRVRHVIRDAEC